MRWKLQRSSLSREALDSGAPWVSRKFGNDVPVYRQPPTVRPRLRYTMATQMQLEVILAGNRIATRVL